MAVLREYLGDGVYVAYSGYGYTLTTGSHIYDEADNIIELEPQVLDALMRFVERTVTIES